MAPALTPRQQRVLFSLCRLYAVSGLPVSSGALVRHGRLEWSSATVRAELKALGELGYVIKPHHAAGRFPTPQAMQLYVRAIPRGEHPSLAVRKAVDLTLEGAQGDGEGMRAAASILSDITGYCAIGLVGDARNPVLAKADLSPLGPERALAMLVTADGSRSVQRLRLDDEVSRELRDQPSEVWESLSRRLSELLHGRTLIGAREELRARLAEREAMVDRLLARSLQVGVWLCTAALLEPLWVHVFGQRWLAQHPNAELDELLGLLDDDHRLAEILCQLLPEGPEQLPRAGVRFDVPFAGSSSAGAGLALVGLRVSDGDIDTLGQGQRAQTGALALLGADRMDFGVVIPLVEYAAQSLFRSDEDDDPQYERREGKQPPRDS